MHVFDYLFDTHGKMMMPDRMHSDTTQTEEIIYTVATYDKDVLIQDFTWSGEGWTNPNGADTSTVNHQMKVDAHQENDAVYYNYNTVANQKYKLLLSLDQGDCDSLLLRIQRLSPQSLISAHSVGSGTYELEFTAQSSQTRMRLLRQDLNGQGTLSFYVDRAVLKIVRDTLYQDTVRLAKGNGYRYGFNGMEREDEWNGVGNSYDFGARIYDARLGRWLARDPLVREFPAISPYAFALNAPIIMNDPDGRKPKVKILPQSFNHEVGSEITSIHQLGVTSWEFDIQRDGKGAITGVSYTVFSKLNYRFVDGPRSVNNPNTQLNKDNPGLYEAVSTHEQKHAEHIKELLEDDTQIYTSEGLSGSIEEVTIGFYKGLDSKYKSGIDAIIEETNKKISAGDFSTQDEVDVYLDAQRTQLTDKLVVERLEFDRSIYQQVHDKLDEKYKDEGGRGSNC